MNERVTPAEVERIGVDLGDEQRDVVPYDPDLAERMFQWGRTLLRLTDQMEADERKTANVQEAWQERDAEIARLKDALHAYNTVTGDGAYHVWIPDEDNHLESLICPVVIPSEWLRDMVAERDEFAVTIDLFADCMDRACRMWREAHPDKPLVWPDGAKNIVWLVEQHEALAAKVQEYEARLKGRVWRPFDTAPQDETEILVYRPDAGVFTARYYPSLNEDDEWDLDNCCWFTAAGEDLTRDLPTHWMPFPDGPDQTIDEEDRQ